MGDIKVGNIVRDKRDGKLFEVRALYGTSGIGRPIDPVDRQKNEQWVIMLDQLEVVLDEETEAFGILYGQKQDS